MFFPFENRGEEVGVTMPHPHGQLYAYPFVPLKIKTELDNALIFYKSNALNLFDYIIDKELNIKERVIFETKHFIVFLPYFTDYPYGIFIVAKSKYVYLHQLSEEEKQDLAIVLKSVVGTFDKLFDKSFPFMMCVHQGALNDPAYNNQEDYYRLHIEFYPPLRNKDTIKYYASSEMGAWAAANTMLVEDCAKELRVAYQKYLDVRN
jgi:UDPglucose--hexose-1-phosphate uridylyltransferase